MGMAGHHKINIDRHARKNVGAVCQDNSGPFKLAHLGHSGRYVGAIDIAVANRANGKRAKLSGLVLHHSHIPELGQLRLQRRPIKPMIVIARDEDDAQRRFQTREWSGNLGRRIVPGCDPFLADKVSCYRDQIGAQRVGLIDDPVDTRGWHIRSSHMNVGNQCDRDRRSPNAEAVALNNRPNDDRIAHGIVIDLCRKTKGYHGEDNNQFLNHPLSLCAATSAPLRTAPVTTSSRICFLYGPS